MFIEKIDLIYYKTSTNKMDTNQNTDCDFYIKKFEYNVFFVNKDAFLTDKILHLVDISISLSSSKEHILLNTRWETFCRPRTIYQLD